LPAPASAEDWGAVEIAEERIAPGELRRFTYQGNRSFEGVRNVMARLDMTTDLPSESVSQVWCVRAGCVYPAAGAASTCHACGSATP